jgi:hypothetical protein
MTRRDIGPVDIWTMVGIVVILPRSYPAWLTSIAMDIALC